MKRIDKYLMMCLIAASAISFPAAGQNRVSVSQTTYAHKGDSVYVELMIRLNNAEVPAHSFVLLTPAIKDDEQSMELPAVMINGKKRHQAYRRLVALNREPVGVGQVINSEDGDASYLYTSTVAYEPWMKNADFAIREDQCDCGGPMIKMNFDLLIGRLQELNPPPPWIIPSDLSTSFRIPNPETVKTRSETGKAYLDFDAGQHNLNVQLNNNAAELKKIGDMIRKAKDDSSVTFTGVVINGYASPEGSYTENLTLSENRVASFKKELLKTSGIDESLLHVKGHGEDWNTLAKLIAESDVAYKKEALEIIRNTEDPDMREKRLKELQHGVPYKDMFANFYPKLRRVDYELQYTVTPFTVEEGKQKLGTNPKLLSLNEMFLIAETYPTDSPEFHRVFEIAATTYPDSDIANFNAGANALSSDDTNAAVRFLDMVVMRDAAYENNLGVLAARQGMNEEAVEHFRKAGREGNQEAAVNLAKIAEANPEQWKHIEQLNP